MVSSIIREVLNGEDPKQVLEKFQQTEHYRDADGALRDALKSIIKLQTANPSDKIELQNMLETVTGMRTRLTKMNR